MSRIPEGAIARLLALALACAACSGRPAGAYPEGAPWGAADPDAAESCGSCHYDYEPQRDSEALSITGLPRTAEPGREYELIVRFDDEQITASGFQLIATAAAADAPAGVFRSDDADIETIGAASRSIRPVKRPAHIRWLLTWRAPQTVAGDIGTPDNEASAGKIVMYLAASAANDDLSPLGDRVHYRSFVVELAAGE